MSRAQEIFEELQSLDPQNPGLWPLYARIGAAVLLALLNAEKYKNAVKQIAWPTVLLVAGVAVEQLELGGGGTDAAPVRTRA